MSQSLRTREARQPAAGVEQLVQDACAVTPGGVNTTIRNVGMPLAFTRAQGAYMYDADGKAYIDYHAAFGAILLGYRHEGVDQAAQSSVGEIDLVGVGTTPLEIELARKIIEHVPAADRVLLCVTGTEATFHAVRVSRAVTNRRKIIKFQGCFHGGSDYLLMNVISPPEKIGQHDPGSAGMLPEVVAHTLIADFNDLASVEALLHAHPDDVAAIIVEPIPHNIGCLLPQPGFLEGLRRLSHEHGAMLIFDEVITGFRHGLGGYQERCGVTPDLVTLGKSLANGYPIAAIAGRQDIMERFATAGGDVFFAGTFNGHPLCTAAALATITELESGTVHEHIFRLGHELRSGLRAIIDRLGIPAQVTGYGSVFVVYFVERDHPIQTYTDLLDVDAGLYVAFHRGMSERGVFMLPLNLKRNHVSASHSHTEVTRTLEVADDVLRELARKGSPRR